MSDELRRSVEEVCVQQPDGSWLVQAPLSQLEWPWQWQWRYAPKFYHLKHKENKEDFVNYTIKYIVLEKILLLMGSFFVGLMVFLYLLRIIMAEYSTVYFIMFMILVFLTLFSKLFIIDHHFGFRRWLTSVGRQVKQEDIPSSFPIRDAAGWRAAWVSYRSPVVQILEAATTIIFTISVGVGLVVLWWM